MLLPYRWLKQYTEVSWSPEELAHRLTMAGMEVSAIIPPHPTLDGVVVGHVRKVSDHPTESKLRVCEVNIGSRTLTLVTAADNIRENMKVPVATLGVRLPGSDRVIEALDFGGVRSEGMLCSEKELGVGDDASGIMELPEDATVGEEIIRALGLDDTILEIKVYANRPDCQSVIGLAREVAALTQGPLHLPEPKETKKGPGPSIPVHVEDFVLCPRFCALVIEDVEIKPSPGWLQSYLRLAGMRPINNVVDVTNFVMLEMGQPLHAYDLSLLAGPELRARRAREGEVLRTLDGQVRALTPEMLVIADASGPVGVAGVMGGETTEISQSTTRIVLEAANFNAASVRRTARSLGLQTEASLRFEKGLDPHLPMIAIRRAAQLIAEVAGGKASSVIVDVHGALPEEREILLRPERVNAMLGADLPITEMKWLLRALHFSVEVTDTGMLSVTVPTYRSDVTQEVDLIEEILRLYGFDRIEPTIPKGSGVRGGTQADMEQFDQLRTRLCAAGLDEVITYSFMNPRSLEALNLAVDDPARQAIPILNPIAEEMSLLRTTLIPGLLEVLARNLRRQAEAVHIYEIGSVFLPESLPLRTQPRECPRLGIALVGDAYRVGWGETGRAVDFYDLKGLVEAVVATLGASVELSEGLHPAFHPGRTASLRHNGQVVGIFGEVHPDTLERFDIAHRAYVAEIDLAPLLGQKRLPVFRPISRYPAVRRDLALLAPLEVPAARVEEIIRSVGEPLLQRLELFDVYQGAQVPDGYRSLAYSLEFQTPERTLTEQEIVEVQNRILERLEKECGVKVRS